MKKRPEIPDAFMTIVSNGSADPNEDALVPFNFGLPTDTWGVIKDLTHGRRKAEDLSDVERRAILDTRHIDGMPPADNLERAIKKWHVAMLYRDPDSGARAESAIAATVVGLPDWSNYVRHGEVAQKRRIKGGGNSGITRNKTKEVRDQNIVTYARTLIGGYDRGQWASMAAKRHRVSVPTARKAIQAAGLYAKPSSPKRKKVVRKKAIRSGR